MANDTLASKAIEAVNGDAFEDRPNFCERFARQVIQAVYGNDFDEVDNINIFDATALKTAKNWEMAQFGFAPQHFDSYPEEGDILFKTQGSGPEGHVGIYVGTVAGVGKNLVAENSSTPIRRIKGAKGYRTLQEFGPVQLAVRLPEPFPSVRILDENGDNMTMGLFRRGVVLVAARAWGEVMQFRVDFDPETKTIRFDDERVDEPLIFLGGHGYLPIRTLATAAGMEVKETHLGGDDKTVQIGKP